jgi:hypothetical protein
MAAQVIVGVGDLWNLKFSLKAPIAKVRDLVLEAQYVYHFDFAIHGRFYARGKSFIACSQAAPTSCEGFRGNDGRWIGFDDAIPRYTDCEI